MKKIVITLCLLIGAGIITWFTVQPKPVAPDVQFGTIDGRKIALSDLRGKVVLIKFWATDCVTCVKQMPDTVDSYQQFKDKGYETIAVAMQHDPPNYVINFAQSRALPFTVALDPVGEIAKAFGDVRLTPTAFLIDQKGRILKRYLGEYDKAEFRALVEKTLAAG